MSCWITPVLLPSVNPIYQFDITVPASVVDGNGHMNNVAYVQWMQDAAISHSDASGCTRATTDLGATWVARSHHIEYLRPSYAGDKVTVLTWVANIRKVRSLRRYQFHRFSDQVLLAQGETDWVFIDAKSGKPRLIPENIKNAFQILTGEPSVNY